MVNNLKTLIITLSLNLTTYTISNCISTIIFVKISNFETHHKYVDYIFVYNSMLYQEAIVELDKNSSRYMVRLK